jgi:hypothetical protein
VADSNSTAQPVRESERLVNDFNRLYYDGPQVVGSTRQRVGSAFPRLSARSTFGSIRKSSTKPGPAWWSKRVSCGGSTLYVATMLDLLGAGEILSEDITRAHVHTQAAQHPRVSLLEGKGAPAIRQSLPRSPRGADHVAPWSFWMPITPNHTSWPGCAPMARSSSRAVI